MMTRYVAPTLDPIVRLVRWLLRRRRAEAISQHRPPRTILVADDFPEILRLNEVHLARAGFAVRTARDGSEALAILRAEPIDLLFTDLFMPGMDGMELMRAVRETPPLRHLPVLLTGAPKPNTIAPMEHRRQILGQFPDADEYLVKPYNPDSVVAAVRALLERYDAI